MRKRSNVRAVILINEYSGDRKDFASIYQACNFLGAQFLQVQRAMLYNGEVNGWRVYESADSIRKHIKDLEGQLKIVEGYDGSE